MTTKRNWAEETLECPDCGRSVTYRIDYTPRGSMSYGGYWPAECDEPTHNVMQPVKMDRRTGLAQLKCPDNPTGDIGEWVPLAETLGVFGSVNS